MIPMRQFLSLMVAGATMFLIGPIVGFHVLAFFTQFGVWGLVAGLLLGGTTYLFIVGNVTSRL